MEAYASIFGISYEGLEAFVVITFGEIHSDPLVPSVIFIFLRWQILQPFIVPGKKNTFGATG